MKSTIVNETLFIVGFKNSFQFINIICLSCLYRYRRRGESKMPHNSCAFEKFEAGEFGRKNLQDFVAVKVLVSFPKRSESWILVQRSAKPKNPKSPS